MIIVFEGPDGAGKTTLLRRIHQELNIPTLKMPKAHETFDDWKVLNALSENYDLLLNQIAWSGHNFLVDRGLLSGLVYSKVYNRHNDLEYIWRIINVNTEITYVILVGDSDKLLARKTDEVIDPDRLVKINEAYKELAIKIPNSIVIDTTNNSEEDCVDQILAFLRGKL